MEELFVIYDGRCGLCAFLSEWITKQPAYVRIRMIASGSPEARQRFPEIPPGELAVASDTGQIWMGDSAWIMCLWALKRFLGISRTLAKPALLPLARQAFAGLSSRRGQISRLFHLEPEEMQRRSLSAIPVPACRLDQ